MRSPRLLIAFLAVVALAVTLSPRADAQTVPAGPVDDGFEPPTNAALADSVWPMSHRNPYNQASSPFPAPTSAALESQAMSAMATAITVAYGPAYDDGSIPVWGSSFFSVWKAVLTPDLVLRKADEQLALPDLSGGLLDAISSAYTVVDADGTFFAARQRGVSAWRDATPGHRYSKMEKVGEYLFPRDVLALGDTITAMNMTYDGVLVLGSEAGTFMALSRDLELIDSVQLPEERVEISNSVAVDEDGGIYAVASTAMYRVQWTGTELSLGPADGAWRAEYEAGDGSVPGRLGAGSGTTPTLMGTSEDTDKFVVIADGQELMHVVLFWRDEIPADWEPIAPGKDRRIAAETPITFGDEEATRTATEQSITVRGYDAMVVSNSYGAPFDRPSGISWLAPFFSGLPAIQPHGVEKFSWDPETSTFPSAWANSVLSCPNGIPSMSAASGLAYCWGARGGIWALEGIDWGDGTSVFTRFLTGAVRFNSFYAATEVGPYGTVASGTLSGATQFVPKAG